MTAIELNEQKAYAGRLETGHGFLHNHEVAKRLQLLLAEIDRLRAELEEARLLRGAGLGGPGG